jgi:hypothetical protein
VTRKEKRGVFSSVHLWQVFTGLAELAKQGIELVGRRGSKASRSSRAEGQPSPRKVFSSKMLFESNYRPS